MSRFPEKTAADWIGKSFHIFCARDLNELGTLKTKATHFGLFLAGNFDGISNRELSDVADTLINEGLVYLCAWGNDCKRVHDIFDIAWVRLRSDIERAGVLMTTWHSDESLEEALQFFVTCTYPDEKFEHCTIDWVAASVGDDSIASRISLYLAAGDFQ